MSEKLSELKVRQKSIKLTKKVPFLRWKIVTIFSFKICWYELDSILFTSRINHIWSLLILQNHDSSLVIILGWIDWCSFNTVLKTFFLFLRLCVRYSSVKFLSILEMLWYESKIMRENFRDWCWRVLRPLSKPTWTDSRICLDFLHDLFIDEIMN